MITRVEADGFKSLRGFAVDLEPLTAIVGVNGTGKSNLFDALRLLSRLPTMSVLDALGEGRGTRRDQFSRTAEGAADHLKLAVELLLPAPREGRSPLRHTRFRYEIELERAAAASGVEPMSVRHEHLTALARGEDAWIARHPDLAPMALYGAEGFFAKVDPDDSRSSASQRTLTWAESSLTLGTLGKERSVLSFPPGLGPEFLEEVAEELSRLRFFHPEVGRLRQQSERSAPTMLASDGANLPTALAALSPARHAEIRADLAAVVPSFRSFDVIPAGDYFAVEVELTDDQRFPARVLSDGTLRFLGLFTLVRSSPPGSVIVLEEPENGIHPGSVRELMSALLDATAPHGELPPQVLVASHSPAVVAALRTRAECLVFADLVRRGDRLLSTRMRHVWREGDPRDRGATTASLREVERYLETARPPIEDP
jgi:predicted ATPase